MSIFVRKTNWLQLVCLTCQTYGIVFMDMNIIYYIINDVCAHRCEISTTTMFYKEYNTYHQWCVYMQVRLTNYPINGHNLYIVHQWTSSSPNRLISIHIITTLLHYCILSFKFSHYHLCTGGCHDKFTSTQITVWSFM